MAIRERTLVFAVVSIGIGFLTWVLWETARRGNTGFGTKSLWDWLDLLIVPLVLAVGAWWLNKAQREAEREEAEKNREEEREIARNRREQETLESYFDRMAELLLAELRLKSLKERDTEVQTIARARTLAVLRNLGPERKGHVVQFLFEAGLINEWAPGPVIALSGANLKGADLYEADLKLVNLEGVDLEEANLAFADLTEANLEGACLKRATLALANLEAARLAYANLEGADVVWGGLEQADLQRANLDGAQLERATLKRANVRGVNLRGADLTGADLEGANVEESVYDADTRWPKDFDSNASRAILVDKRRKSD